MTFTPPLSPEAPPSTVARRCGVAAGARGITCARAAAPDGSHYISSESARCLGSYVFLWGQKQERTPTWYGMFVEDRSELGLHGESCPTVDVMQHEWSGVWPANRAPEVTALTVNGLAANQNVSLGAGQSARADVTATDPEDDPLLFVWEVLPEPTDVGSGGSYEPRPPAVAGAIQGSGAEVQLSVSASGQYRVFVYALDGNGSVGTANVPFTVQ